jgi:hypothetical protein
MSAILQRIVVLTGLLGSMNFPPASAGAEAGEPMSFRRDILPVLTKAGCNAGACHGAFHGRGGFRLSLLGFDPQADYNAIVKEARGRRVFPAAPEQSLIVRKPLALVPHGGERRFSSDSESCRILLTWIRQGMPGPEEERLVRLEVTPGESLLRIGETASLQVRAVWSSGGDREVSRWALFETSRDAVAEVSPEGVVTARGHGRAVIMVRFFGQVAAVPVTIPHPQLSLQLPPSNHFIDEGIVAEWRKLGLEPAPLADDSEFVRRLYLDLIGTLPTPDEVRRFLNSRDPDKRRKAIDEVLERPEYVDYWALKWGDLLRAHRRSLGEKGLSSFNAWLRQALREDWPVDRIVRELLTARGNLYTTGPVAFYFIDRTPEELAETTAQVFLGVRLQCAKCHHHPFEVWSQEDYHGLAAFFARVERKDTLEGGRYGGAQSIRLAATGRLTHPNTGQEVAPRALGQAPIGTRDLDDPRQALAAWVTGNDNPYFARSIVNRYWGYLFGRGLVEPIDDLRATNPASHPAVLDALAQDFARHGFRLKHLLRTLASSHSYQLASELAPRRDHDGMFFTHRRPRQLPAEVLLDAINQAASTTETFDDAGRSRFGSGKVLPGTRAIALPDPIVPSYFLDVFSRPQRISSCECERPNQPGLSQILHLINGETLQRKVTDPRGRVATLLASKKTDTEIIEELFLAALARPPRVSEQEKVRKLLAAAPSRKEGFEDLLWTLLNMTEFVCNH